MMKTSISVFVFISVLTSTTINAFAPAIKTRPATGAPHVPFLAERASMEKVFHHYTHQEELTANSLGYHTTFSNPQFPSLADSLHSVIKAAKQEIGITYRLMKGNLLTNILLGMSCTTVFCLARSSPLSLVQWASALAKSAIWFFIYGYHFDLANQVTGVEEDKLNKHECKKDRPLVTGEMSIEGGKKRWIGSGVLFLAVSWLFGGKVLALLSTLWVFTTFIYYGTSSFGGHFAVKNYYGMSAASVSMLLGARKFAGEAGGNILVLLLTSCYLGLTADIQDFRDEKGDRAVNRKTTAVLLGVKNARKVWAVQFLAVTTVAACQACLPGAILLA